MPRDFIKPTLMGPVAVAGIALVLVLVVLLTAYAVVPDVSAQDKKPTPTPSATPTPPPDDCWGGALSDDPLQCYVLEQAQTAGVIDIDAVYGANEVLYVYLGQTDPVGEAVGAFFKQKSAEFVDRWPDRVYYGHPFYESCLVDHDIGDKGCLLEEVTYWKGDSILPPTRSYTKIVLREGGAAARMSERGWASYRQLWPAVSRGSSGAGNMFDVSEVDMTNIPPVDCLAPTASGLTSCNIFQSYPGLGIAGFRGGYWKSRGPDDHYRAQYVEVKVGPDEELDVEAIKDAMVASAKKENLTVIPVKYSYEDLWRWATIIQRFSLTRGNTIGITWAHIRPNIVGGIITETVFPLATLPEATEEVPENIRTTIGISTLNLQQTVDALPQLLGQLNIPVDAVGLVARRYDAPNRRFTPLSGLAPSKYQSEPVPEPSGNSPWTSTKVLLSIIVGGSLAVLLSGSTVFIGYRIRRRSA